MIGNWSQKHQGSAESHELVFDFHAVTYPISPLARCSTNARLSGISTATALVPSWTVCLRAVNSVIRLFLIVRGCFLGCWCVRLLHLVGKMFDKHCICGFWYRSSAFDAFFGAWRLLRNSLLRWFCHWGYKCIIHNTSEVEGVTMTKKAKIWLPQNFETFSRLRQPGSVSSRARSPLQPFLPSAAPLTPTLVTIPKSSPLVLIWTSDFSEFWILKTEPFGEPAGAGEPPFWTAFSKLAEVLSFGV